MKYFLLSTFLFVLLVPMLVVPLYTHAANADPVANGELIPCGNDLNGDGVVDASEQCQFNGLIALVNNVITWLIKISTIIATGVFAYAGFQLLTSGGNESAMTKAKSMLGKVIIGYIVILIAWVLVYTIMSTLVKPGASTDLIGAIKN